MVDLKKLSEKCIDILAGKIHNAELDLIIDIPEDTPNILGEELAIKQMLMNILSNAIKFTPSKGKVTISTEVEDKGSLRFAITDTGIGISDDEIENALSAFTQLDGGDLSRQNSGTGLGLTLVNALIKMHNGRLELVSQKGIGTTATLIFPLDRVLPKNVSRSELEMMASNDAPSDEEQASDVFGSAEDTNPYSAAEENAPEQSGADEAEAAAETAEEPEANVFKQTEKTPHSKPLESNFTSREDIADYLNHPQADVFAKPEASAPAQNQPSNAEPQADVFAQDDAAKKSEDEKI